MCGLCISVCRRRFVWSERLWGGGGNVSGEYDNIYMYVYVHVCAGVFIQVMGENKTVNEDITDGRTGTLHFKWNTASLVLLSTQCWTRPLHNNRLQIWTHDLLDEHSKCNGTLPLSDGLLQCGWLATPCRCVTHSVFKCLTCFVYMDVVLLL